VKEFALQPDLEKEGWRARLPLEQLVHYDQWGQRQRKMVQPKSQIKKPLNKKNAMKKNIA
jgi:hypothetical protein